MPIMGLMVSSQPRKKTMTNVLGPWNTRHHFEHVAKSYRSLRWNKWRCFFLTTNYVNMLKHVKRPLRPTRLIMIRGPYLTFNKVLLLFTCIKSLVTSTYKTTSFLDSMPLFTQTLWVYTCNIHQEIKNIL